MQSVNDFVIMHDVRERHQIHPLIKINVEKVTKEEFNEKLRQGLEANECQRIEEIIKVEPVLLDEHGKRMPKKRGRKRKNEYIDVPYRRKFISRPMKKKTKRVQRSIVKE